eukprot:g19421.t2
MAGVRESPAGKAERGDAGAEEKSEPQPKRAKLLSEPLMSVENDSSTSDEDGVENRGSDSEYEYQSEPDDDEIANWGKERKHRAEVEAEAFNEALDGISAMLDFVSTSLLRIRIYVQPWRLFEGLSDSTMEALGLEPMKGVMVMLTTDQQYTMANQTPQVRWAKQVEPALADAKGDPIDDSCYLNLTRAAIIALTAIDRLRNADKYCFVCGDAMPEEVSAVRFYTNGAVARQKTLCQFNYRTQQNSRAEEEARVAAAQAQAAQPRRRQPRRRQPRPRRRQPRPKRRQPRRRGRQPGPRWRMRETVEFLIDLFRRGLEGSRPELGLPEHLLEPQLLGPWTTGNDVEDVSCHC